MNAPEPTQLPPLEQLPTSWPADERLDASVVAFGGGHGLAVSLSALRRVVTDLTAVVTVADNGGSSGRLRRDYDVLPPGDLRMALAALCGDDQWGRTWADVLQHRFSGDGDLRGHSLGNLLIVGLWDLLGDSVDGLRWVSRLLGAAGRVLPMSTVPMDITARVRRPDGEVVGVRGQEQVATADGEVLDVALDPHDPPACAEAIEAVRRADWLVLGPGSWFTSVIPHLLVPDLLGAMTAAPGRVLVTMNLAEQAGETEGYGPEEHLDALLSHAPGLRVHTVLVDRATAAEATRLEKAVDAAGARLVVADVAVGDGSAAHHPDKLAAAYARIVRGV